MRKLQVIFSRMATHSRWFLDESIFFDVGEARYVAWKTRQNATKWRSDKPQLATVIPTGSRDCVDTTWLEAYVAECIRTDDVFQVDFLSNIFLLSDSGCQVEPELKEWAQDSWGTNSIEVWGEDDGSCPPGPFAVLGEHMYKAHRLYDDTQGAFLIPTKPSTEGSVPTRTSSRSL